MLSEGNVKIIVEAPSTPRVRLSLLLKKTFPFTVYTFRDKFKGTEEYFTKSTSQHQFFHLQSCSWLLLAFL